MTTSEYEIRQLLKELGKVNRRLGEIQYQLDLIDEVQKKRSHRSDFPIVGDFISVMFDALITVVKSIIELGSMILKSR